MARLAERLCEAHQARLCVETDVRELVGHEFTFDCYSRSIDVFSTEESAELTYMLFVEGFEQVTQHHHARSTVACHCRKRTKI